MNRFFLTALLFCALGSTVLAQSPKQIPLPTSKQLTVPSPGHLGSLNGFPGTIALSPDQHYAALLNDGYGAQANGAHQSIAILDLKTNQLTDFPESRLAESAPQSYFIGLAFSSDGNHLYASMGSITDPTGVKPGATGNGIVIYSFHEGKVTPERFLNIPPQKLAAGKKVAYGVRKTAPGTAIPYPAGLAVITTQNAPDKILVANNFSDNVVLLDSATGHILQQIDLSTHAIVPSSYPYTVVASRDGRRAWCSLWNASRVAELDLEKGTVVRWIPLLEPSDPIAPGSHPTALLLSPDEKQLYVALSNADQVMVVPVDSNGPIRPLGTKPIPQLKYGGTCPDALALSPAGKRLFVADACINAVAVFDIPSILKNPTTMLPIYQPLGFIPTDWYPTALATVGDDLLIATAKGQGTGPNNFPGHTGYERHHRENAYIPTLLYGSLARVNIPKAEAHLEELTRRVEKDNLFLNDPGLIQFAQGTNPIHHVIYILKENRTYDQIFGDLKAGGQKIGNGDPSLTMYGADVTPNLHKLALQFGVLDNFYDSGEVSGDGHEWSMAAITTDYNEKNWTIGYRGHERTYDSGGTIADEIPMENGEPDVDAPSTGYLWDNAASHGITYRDYGEFIQGVWCKAARKGSASPKEGTPSPLTAGCSRPVVNRGEVLPENIGQPRGSASPWPWAVPLLARTKATKAVLRGHFDPNFPDFNTEYPDQLRADEFLNEFDGFVTAHNNKANKETELPAFVLLYLPDDHTHGTQAGKPRPAASVADNDLAVGRVVEAVSHSPYWDDTAIFIVEDDAQDGADHVDAHRSIAFAISKYSPGSSDHPFVDSRFYTTVNMIHTMESLIGLPPMNQNDAYAPVMAPLFSGPGNQPSFTADWSNRDNGLIYETNPAHSQGADESAKMDFTHPDANNPAILNAILWHDRKGNTPMPAPIHAVFPAKSKPDND
ncbi:MAG: bifunctional YncE family protein/alkaline phosphatase family protein [Terriglobales bacterium]